MYLCIPELSTVSGTWWEGWMKEEREEGRTERGREEKGVLHLSAQLVCGQTEPVT